MRLPSYLPQGEWSVQNAPVNSLPALSSALYPGKSRIWIGPIPSPIQIYLGKKGVAIHLYLEKCSPDDVLPPPSLSPAPHTRADVSRAQSSSWGVRSGGLSCREQDNNLEDLSSLLQGIYIYRYTLQNFSVAN